MRKCRWSKLTSLSSAGAVRRLVAWSKCSHRPSGGQDERRPAATPEGIDLGLRRSGWRCLRTGKLWSILGSKH
ncbi:hypothetical protein EJ03DRAFT_121773 [Teratosphaeria nubilosa]|uniref:Uncharacterized protein n=1 Tax=Teratosphaeria nubilosa TaxID=161662 RepID=A0A6G1L5Z4_9PEZI|nr:hypothetical protein EJ03DRAFT_121773 [Teratosphaeria nubilosa]